MAIRKLQKLLNIIVLLFVIHNQVLAQYGIKMSNYSLPPYSYEKQPGVRLGEQLYLQIEYRFPTNAPPTANTLSIVLDKHVVVDSFGLPPSYWVNDTMYWDLKPETSGYFSFRLVYTVLNQVPEKVGTEMVFTSTGNYSGVLGYTGDSLAPVYGNRQYNYTFANRIAVCDPYLMFANATVPDTLGYQWVNYYDTSLIGELEGRFLVEMNQKEYMIATTTNPLNFIRSRNRMARVYKTDSIGKLLWKLNFYNLNRDYLVEGMEKAPDNTVVLFGHYSPSPMVYPAVSGWWLAKIDAKGKVLWEQNLDKPGFNKIYDRIYGLKVLAGDGSMIMLSSPISTPFNITKIDKDGNIVSAKSIASQFYGGALAIKPNGNYLVLLNNDNGQHLMEFDAAYNVVSTKQVAGGNKGSLTSITRLKNGGYILTGRYMEAFGCYDYNKDAWVVKVNEQGVKEWEGFYGGSKDELVSKCVEMPDGNLAIVANTFSDDGNVRHFQNGLADGWLLIVDTTGKIVWDKCITGPLQIEPCCTIGFDWLSDIIPNNDGTFTGLAYAGNSRVIDFLFKLGPVNRITGLAFYDGNKDGQQNDGEHVLTDVLIQTSKSNYNSITTKLDENGRFVHAVDTGRYITMPLVDTSVFAVTPHLSQFQQYGLHDSVMFAVQPKVLSTDLAISLLPVSVALIGEPVEYKLIAENKGTSAVNGFNILFVKDSRVLYDSSSRPTSSIQGDSIVWHMQGIAPFEKKDLTVYGRLKIPPVLNVNDTLFSLTAITPVQGETGLANNSNSLIQVAIGSYDPNDKTETHGGVITRQLLEKNGKLTYIIRFQNTGTAPARKVEITDTLDNKLDWGSLQLLGASHDYQFSIKGGRYLKWSFNPIHLPDSTTDNAGSNGFVSYTIKPVKTLQVGDTIVNKAAIYFDYNLPIITNEALVAMISAGCPKGNTWTGLVSTAWENPNNWSCGSVPTGTTDVLIKAGTPHQPIVNSSTKVNSITAGRGAQLMVKAGVVLEVKGK